MMEFRTPDQPSVATLVGNIVDHTRHLVRQEISLVKVELRTELRQLAMTAGKGLGLLAGGTVFAVVALAFLGLTLMLGLTAALDLPLWLSALVVTILYLIVAGVLALIGRSVLERARMEQATRTTATGD